MYLIPTEESLYEISSADSKSQSRKRSRAEQSSATDCSSHRPQQRRRVSITKSVRFATVQVVPAPCTSSPETWYTPVEYSGFKSNVKRDVMYMAKLCQLKQQLPVEHQPKMNKDEYCPLGLEKYCCSTTEQKRAKSVKVARVQAVLDQQAIQQQLLALHGPTSQSCGL